MPDVRIPKGITLPSGNSATPPNQYRIRWVRQSDGSLAAEIVTYDDGLITVSQWNSRSPSQVASTQITSTIADNDLLSQLVATASDVNSSFAVKIIDSNGNSRFPQLGSTADTRINFGLSSLTFAASTDSNTTSFAHGLGTTADQVFFTPITSPAFTQIPKFNITGLGAVNVDVNARIDVALNGNINFCWLAIGTV